MWHKILRENICLRTSIPVCVVENNGSKCIPVITIVLKKNLGSGLHVYVNFLYMNIILYPVEFEYFGNK